MTWRPAKDHPWRTGPSSKAVTWAREESKITEVRTVRVARSENLSNRDVSKWYKGKDK